MSAALRYRIAGNQAQLTLGGSVLIVDPAGPLVEYADYARLKEKSACQAEALNAFDKKLREAEAEVERLNTGIQPEGSNDAVGRAVNVLLEKEKEISRLKAECQARQAENSVLAVECDSLKAENERLRKAGDDMLHYWSSGTGTDLENFIKAVWLWTTAKQPPTDLKSSAD
jgi:hypothetical protein